MKVQELIDALERINNFHPNQEVFIPVRAKFTTIGGSPCVGLKHVNAGFDWDSGKVFLVPDSEVTKSIDSEVEEMRKLHDRIARLEYENRNLKSDIKKLKTKLEKEIV